MRYVAVGDSFTEGVGDDLPDGTVRGWADRFAAGLATTRGEVVHYANLAVRGRLLEQIVNGQLEAALSLSPPPTLLTLNGGGNDMMRPGADLARLLALTRQAVRRCLDAGVQVVLIAGPDPSARLPLGSVMHRREAELTGLAAALAAEHDLVFVDGFHDLEVRRPVYWSPDRLHLNPAGHQRVADLVLNAVGHPGAVHLVDPAPPDPRRVLAEARYYREHVLPWVARRVRRRSSGDGRVAKYPDWVPVRPDGAAGRENLWS